MRLSAVLISIAVIAACDSPSDVANSPRVQTDDVEYDVQTRAFDMFVEIPFTFSNPTDDTLIIGHCGGYSAILEKKVNGVWTPALGIPNLDCGGLIRVAPHSTHRGVIPVFAVNPWILNTEPKFLVDSVAGEYRIVLKQAYRSNSFWLKQLDLNETTCSGQHDYAIVASWARQPERFYIDGVTSYWFDTSKVCLAIGIANNEVLPRLEAKLKESGIPRSGVRVFVASALDQSMLH